MRRRLRWARLRRRPLIRSRRAPGRPKVIEEALEAALHEGVDDHLELDEAVIVPLEPKLCDDVAVRVLHLLPRELPSSRCVYGRGPAATGQTRAWARQLVAGALRWRR